MKIKAIVCSSAVIQTFSSSAMLVNVSSLTTTAPLRHV